MRTGMDMAGPWTAPAPRRLGQRRGGVVPTAHRPLDKASPCPHAHARSVGLRFAFENLGEARPPPRADDELQRTF